MTALEDIKRKPGVSAAFAAAPHCGWPEEGLTIYGSPSVGITCQYNAADYRKAVFTGWNGKDFHYVPRGLWSDWVRLAHLILEIDAALCEHTSQEKADG